MLSESRMPLLWFRQHAAALHSSWVLQKHPESFKDVDRAASTGTERGCPAGDGLQEGGDGVRRSMRVSRAPLAWYLNDFKHFSRKNHRSASLAICTVNRDAARLGHAGAGGGGMRRQA